MNIIKKILLTLFLLFIPFSTAYAEDTENYPNPTQYKYVNDYANIISSNTRDKIISIGHELYTKTEVEIVAVTIDKLPENTSIESYATGLFRKWGIGSKEKNNGVLLLVAYNNREMRIEVGYGLEGAIPDSVAGSIRDDYIIPYFSEGDYNSGILNGYNQLCLRAAREYNVELTGVAHDIDVKPENRTSKNTNLPLIIAGLLFLAFDGIFLRFRIVRFLLFLMASSGRRGGRGGFGGGRGSGGGFGGFGGGSSGGGGASGKW